MAQISPREVFTTVTAASRIERTRIAGKLGALDADLALPGKQRAVATVAGRDHTVEHIEASAHGVNNILRPADAHQIARLILGQQLRREGADRIELLFALAHAEAADGKAVEIQRRKLIDAKRRKSSNMPP